MVEKWAKNSYVIHYFFASCIGELRREIRNMSECNCSRSALAHFCGSFVFRVAKSAIEPRMFCVRKQRICATKVNKSAAKLKPSTFGRRDLRGDLRDKWNFIFDTDNSPRWCNLETLRLAPFRFTLRMGKKVWTLWCRLKYKRTKFIATNSRHESRSNAKISRKVLFRRVRDSLFLKRIRLRRTGRQSYVRWNIINLFTVSFRESQMWDL